MTYSSVEVLGAQHEQHNLISLSEFESFFHMPYLSELIQYFSFSISLHMTPSRSIHVIANGRISFCLWLNIIPLYIGTTSSVSIHLLQTLPCLGSCNPGSGFTQVSVCFLLNDCPANQAGLPNQHPGGADQGLDGAVQQHAT